MQSICNNMDGPRGCYAKSSKSERTRQIPYNFTYMWNLKNKISEQAKWKQTHRYRKTNGCQMGEGLCAGWKR